MQIIMFNDKYGLTKAVLEGRKTQTRRLALRSKENVQILEEINFKPEDESLLRYIITKYSRYTIGEAVAVAQSYHDVLDYYRSLGRFDERTPTGKELIFHNEMRIMESTGNDSAMRGDDNKMFVRADLMPFQIRITGIRLERLQSISDDDCLKEGVRKWEDEKEYLSDDTVRKSVDELKAAGYDGYTIPGCWMVYPSAREAYAALIDKVSGIGTWARNPWVFVYAFELVK